MIHKLLEYVTRDRNIGQWAQAKAKHLKPRCWNFHGEISVEGSITHSKTGWKDYHLIAINYSKLHNCRVIEVTLLFCINFGVSWLVTPKPANPY